ncbi:Cytochrome c biogenesis protein CCS1 [Abeliophyllum distichum]|uniref:Cytochrome c biogenesis protein CCS1 n=1 Tax=Abeliophyllum distichum TaxID=126358 RepID=A0ABD1P8J0_9LAMI
MTVSCKLKTSKNDSNNKSKNKSLQTKIVVPELDGAPALSEAAEEGESAGDRSVSVNPPPSPSKKSGLGMLKGLPRRVLSVLSNLPLAIAEMFAVAALMALGTIIDQGEAPDYYFQKYPEDNPVFGFFTWRWVLTLGFDRMFSSPVFLGTLALLGASLIACTYTTQIPVVKVAKRWSFLHSEAIRRQEYSDTLPRASLQDLGIILVGAGYEVFLKGPSLYAFKGLAGSATGSFKGSVTVPQGLNFVIGDVLGPSGFLSTPSESFNTEVHVNRFYMDYYDSGEVSQFYSDLSLFDLNGKEVMRKTISVNHPLRYGGITIYQTDWSLSALQVIKDDEGPYNLAMAPLKINGDKKLYGTFLPVGDADSPDVKGISMLARDLQSIDAIGSTGLDIKTDPGVPIVYAGFGALMLTTCISFLSHSQIWALQDGTTLVIGGKTNRAKGEFPEEMNRLLDQVPEIVESTSSTRSDNFSG